MSPPLLLAAGNLQAKIVTGIKHNYYLDGLQIVAETWTLSGIEYLLYYIYDESGAPIGMQYRTSNYASGVFDFFFFEKNVQGDIIGIYNSTGKRIGSYTYDAWGNCNYTTASGNTTLERQIVSFYNPFRYRGYYYDYGIGFYYLQSRYYNPQWGRFLNADGYVSTGTGLLGYNMFAYCNNNPVMFTDPTGEFIFGAILLALGCVAVSGLTSCAISYNSPDQTIDASDTSWIKDDPIIQAGRHESFDDALNDATEKMQIYANTHVNEGGCYIYQLYGGYYASAIVSGILATEGSVKIPTNNAPNGAIVLAYVHSHSGHRYSILYQQSEYREVVSSQIPSYVVDTCGCVYGLFPEARGYTDYKVIRSRKAW